MKFWVLPKKRLYSNKLPWNWPIDWSAAVELLVKMLSIAMR